MIFTARKRSLGQGNIYRLQQSCGQGNIFTPVCHSVHRGGLPQCMLGCHPPGADHPLPLDQTPRTRQTPPEQTTHLTGPDPPGPGRPPQSRHQSPRTGQIPPGLGRPPIPLPTPSTPPLGSRLQHMVYKRMVHILLECILVSEACVINSVHRWGHAWLRGVCVVAGGPVWLLGGMCGWWWGLHGCRGACVVAGGNVWLPGGVHGCWGVMCGCWGACVVARGCVCMAVWGACMVGEGHVWLWGACMAAGGCAWLWGMHGCGGVHGCQGGMCGCWGVHGCWGVCMAVGGVCGCRGVRRI